MTGTELREKRKAYFKISTGSKALNKILGGGFESGSVSEVYGEYRCGKTQISHTMCVTAQSSGARGGGKVAVLDTEGTFRPERINQIAERYEGELLSITPLHDAFLCGGYDCTTS